MMFVKPSWWIRIRDSGQIPLKIGHLPYHFSPFDNLQDVASYLQQQGDELKAYADAYRVNVIPYDWRLNDNKNVND